MRESDSFGSRRFITRHVGEPEVIPQANRSGLRKTLRAHAALAALEQMSDGTQHLVFVYGTLMRGEENVSHMGDAVWVAEASTLEGWAMYELDGYPGIVPEAGAKPLPGELWRVSAEQLAHLDAFEGVDEGLYRRERHTVACRSRTESAWVYVYAGSVATKRRLSVGWRAR